jgi:hypothetical protein
MLCPRCGGDLLPGNTFCHRCRARVAAAPGPDTAPPHRTRGLRRIAVVLALVAAAALATILLVAQRGTELAANEAAAASEVRHVLNAEMAYAQANGGHYDRLECLVDPAACVPRYPAGGPRFLADEAIRAPTRRGYRFVLHLGPAPERRNAARVSPSSVAAFAYVAVPDVPGRTGRRSFCTDASRRVCEIRRVDDKALAEGACPLSCVDLR